MVQAETVCKLITILQSGRKTYARIAEESGKSKKTIGRYIQVMSAYFPIQQERRGHAIYLWIPNNNRAAKGEGGRSLIARFCPRGHDKHAPHGGYWMRQGGRVWLVCAVCRRRSNNKWYAENKNGVVRGD